MTKHILSHRDLIPHESRFTLKATGKTYELGCLTLSDEFWVKDTFGVTLQELLKQADLKALCRIVFRVMKPESKKDFGTQNVKFMNEEGEELTVKMGGWQILAHLVAGQNEQEDMLQALLDTMGYTREFRESLERQEAEKKSEALLRAQEAEAKIALETQIGSKSLMPSHQNMVGAPSIFSQDQAEKFSPVCGPFKKGITIEDVGSVPSMAGGSC